MAMIIGTVTTSDRVERSRADADSASIALYLATVIWAIVKANAKSCGLAMIAPHDLRRTCARLCHQAEVVYPCVCNRELSGRRAEAILDWHGLFDVPACKI